MLFMIDAGSEQSAGLFSVEQLKRHAVLLAEQHRVSMAPAQDVLLSRLADDERRLRKAYTRITTALAREGATATAAENWLLDNFYLIEQQIALVRRHLPKGYSRRLPKLYRGDRVDIPRVHELATELISHTDGRVDIGNISTFVSAYQSVSPLQIGELWAIPIMLQLALLRNLRYVVDSITAQRLEREQAVAWAERMVATAKDDPGRLPRLLAEFADANIELTAQFVEQFQLRLAQHGAPLNFVKAWVEHRLAERGQSLAMLTEVAGHTAATCQLSIANSIGSLRFINGVDWRDFVESLSHVEQVLQRDPVDVYARQDFTTRDRCRHAVEELARHCDSTEIEVAETAIRLASESSQQGPDPERRGHVGYYLVNRGRRKLMQVLSCSLSWQLRAARVYPNVRLLAYVGAIGMVTLLATAGVLALFSAFDVDGAGFVFMAVTGLLAASSVAVALVNLAVTVLLPPRTMSRLDFSGGIPNEHRTVVVVPTLLAAEQDVDHLLEAMEVRYLGNRDANLQFALLTDFTDADAPSLPQDERILDRMQHGIAALNARYGADRSDMFLLFHRPRTWNEHDGLWSGHERKRGKLEQFNALLRGGSRKPFSRIIGNVDTLQSVRYVITLDTDTQLPRNAARLMVGYMAHPLNRPVFHAEAGRVIEGFGILQPRTSISLASANRSLFARLYAGDTGIDPYTREISDVYQDLFAEGSFVGKGIYDVDAFRQATEARFPENLILSHDLIEGGHARSALISDVDLIEEHPVSYAVDASRRHRWMRGDWQVACWLLPKVPGPGKRGVPWQSNPLGAVSRWKLFDNIRRNLVAPALLGFLLGGWWLGGASAWVWTAVFLLLLVLPAVANALVTLLRKPRLALWTLHLRLVSEVSIQPLMRAALTVILLPYEALLSLNALAWSALRMPFTRRSLLRWQLPQYARRNRCHSVMDFFREMWAGPAVVLVTAAMMLTPLPLSMAQLMGVAPLLLVWLVSPVIGWWISLPVVRRQVELSARQKQFLRAVTRRTWHYFEHLNTADDNWLIPDNLQAYPDTRVARRTSPTNIGMSLLANLTAVDFGYIHGGELVALTQRTFATLDRLPRHRGHFYNWYDTGTLEVLPPHYISSVDSGNLAGCLLVLQQALAELPTQPVLPGNLFSGLEDTLQRCLDALVDDNGKAIADARAQLEDLLWQQEEVALSDMRVDMLTQWLEAVLMAGQALTAAVQAVEGEGEKASTDKLQEAALWASAFADQCSSMLQEIRDLIPQPDQFSVLPSLATLQDLSDPPDAVRQRMVNIEQLQRQCKAFLAMDFSFLYDRSSDLLSIGYDVSERRLDPACYDLLASEARLASFLLVAWDQVPQEHWFTLGRLLAGQGGDVSLVSWSGSMFEYLMPQLFLPAYENTLLDRACRAAVTRQIAYGHKRGVPWGISESCYHATDAHQTYQYRAFGVPGLGLKRGLADDLVVAPYASALALTVLPVTACHNLRILADKGFLGEYGFYEAIDYSPGRIPRGQSHALVQCFMAHHQGMSLLALSHALLDQPIQRRLLADPQVRATTLLLQERMPRSSIAVQPHMAEVSAATRQKAVESRAVMRVFTNPHAPRPEVHLLSNGHYNLMVTHAGGSYSHCDGIALTRWREDSTCDQRGTFVYFRDDDSGRYWSATHQPIGEKADHYEAIFVQARAEYRRRDHDILTHTELCVSPEDDVEIRRVTLTNQSSRIRHIEVTSYAEVVLAPMNADLAHPAFSNLFVRTEILPGKSAILCMRRPREAGDPTRWMFHLLAVPKSVSDSPSYETDRSRFIGRGRTSADPRMLAAGVDNSHLSNTDGAVLDPIVAIRRTLILSEDESASAQIITGMAETREQAIELVERYSDHYVIERAFELAWFRSQEVTRQLDSNEADAQLFGRLASSLVFAGARHRAPSGTVVRNCLGQASLWRFAVSGDLPIVLVQISSTKRIRLLRQILQAHAYWRMKGLRSDLVIINEDFSGYRADLHDEITGLVNRSPDLWQMDRPGGVFLRRTEELSEDERVLLQSVARVVIDDQVETLTSLLAPVIVPERLPDRLWKDRTGAGSGSLPAHTVQFDNGFGGFSQNGREYVISLKPGQRTPAPWVNVIASPHIGTVVSESGSAYTWVDNAHELRLTQWHNDPVSDATAEVFYVRDEDSGAFWSPTALPAPSASEYRCRHGFGYSIFEQICDDLQVSLTLTVSMEEPVKIAILRFHNQSASSRKLSATAYWELVLGDWRHSNAMHIITERDVQTGAILARNAYNRTFSDRVCFAAVSEDSYSMSGSRQEFIGRNGSLAAPAALFRKRLSNLTGARLDPCAAIQTPVEVGSGQTREIVFVFGAARDVGAARKLVQRYANVVGAHQALEATQQYWEDTLGAVRVKTPDPALDVLTNGWLLYQTLSCRMWGRSGYYQSGGAYGFRDQLQDSLALLHTEPSVTRQQILRCASRQFRKGDVQHWWHPPDGQGVRTHFSDDYLWLPWVCCHYVHATGDQSVLDEMVHFLEGRELHPEEEASYGQPQRSTERASLYEHCVRAIRYGLRFGEHGLPLMGCGDWNDGMNRVGIRGQGESVWLAWFLFDTLQRFADLAEQRADVVFAGECREQAQQLRENIEAQAWDGEWYRRAWFDDGTPLGSSDNEECSIDAISQAWAVLSGAGDGLRSEQAMEAVYRKLVRTDARLIQLLDPPFDHSSLEPGYIKGYPPGVRENGGQYTHAAIWTTMAFARMGQTERAWSLLDMLNPVRHGDTPDRIATYRVEPYVMSADVYWTAPHTGRGGWTWYTGAAGWMYRLITETLLGLRRQGEYLCIAPCVPDTWEQYSIDYRYGDTWYHIVVESAVQATVGAPRLEVDGVAIDGTDVSEGSGGANGVRFRLEDDGGEHQVVIRTGLSV